MSKYGHDFHRDFNRRRGIAMTKRFISIFAALLAILAITGLALSERGEATPADKSPAKSDAATAPAGKSADKAAPAAEDPVVAKVDGQPIKRSEVLAFMKNIPPQMQQLPPETLFPVVLEQVINGKIVEEKASKTDVANDPEVAKRLAEAKEQIIRIVFMEHEINKNLTDTRLRKAYDKFAAEQGNIEEVKASHILVDKESEAKDIIKKLQAGAKFEDLAKEHSKDTANKSIGGDLGYFTKDAMVKEFSDAAFAMKKGDVSKTPVKTQFGWHVIKVEDRRVRPVPDFDTVKSALEAQERRQILNELLESWRKSATVETFDINGNPVKKKEEPAKTAP
jgi:peptidyl-prolyl cis-trans isomerase C